MSEESTKELMERALKAEINIPNWVVKQHESIYRICYLQVKESPELSLLPSSERKDIIIKLMNQFISTMIKNAQKKQESKNEDAPGKDISDEEENDRTGEL